MFLLERSGSEQSHKRLLRLLGEARVDLPSALPNSFEKAQFCPPDIPEETQEEWLSYHEALGGPGLEGILESVIAGESDVLRKHASEIMSRLLAKRDPDASFAKLLEQDHSSKKLVDVLSETSSKISEDKLSRGLAHTDGHVRLLSVQELAKRGSLDTPAANALLKDPCLEVREFCVGFLLAKGEKLSPEAIREILTDVPERLRAGFPPPRADEFVAQVLIDEEYEALCARVKWLAMDAPVAYRILAVKHFDKMGQRIRTDIRDRFEPLKQEWIVSSSKELLAKVPLLKANASALTAAKLVNALVKKEVKPEIQEFVRRRYLAAAMAGLAEHGNRSDLDLARALLGEKSEYMDEPKAQAIILVKKYGEAGDVPMLVV